MKSFLFAIEITPGMLRILHRHMGTNCKIQTAALTEKWREIGFPKVNKLNFLDDLFASFRMLIHKAYTLKNPVKNRI